MKIFLTGLPRVGKSTCGKLLAAKRGVPFYDTDALVGDTRALFVEQGEQALRQREAEVIQALPDGPGVVSLGGGALENAAVREHLKGKIVVYLRCPVDIVWRRMQGNLPTFICTQEDLKRLAQKRALNYETVATAIVDIAEMQPQEVVERIGEKYGEQ